MCSCTAHVEVHPESLSVQLDRFRKICLESCRYEEKNVLHVNFIQLVSSGIYKYDRALIMNTKECLKYMSPTGKRIAS